MAVCGPHDGSPEECRTAADVGRLLAEAGAVVVCGGGAGVMEAAARGASEAGGTVVGLLATEEHDDANAHCTVVVPTGLGEARNVLVVRAADAVIAVGGGWGTLSEIGFAMRIGRPVVSLCGWEPRRNGRAEPGIVQVRDAEEAVRAALAAARRDDARL